MLVKLAGSDLAYDVQGDGPPLLLLHAFPLGMAMWDPQVEAFARQWQVVRFDARGFGGSPPGGGLLTMERIAGDAAQLLDHLGLGQAVVCGLSMGGYAAFALMRLHRDRVRALVLCDTKAGADTPEARAARAAQAENVLKEGPGAIADATLPKLLGATTQKEKPQLAKDLKALIEKNPARGIADALAGLAARADSVPTLREIKVPTLLLFGEEDAITPPAEGQALHKAITGSRLTVLPKAGHLSNLETPAAFNEALRRFLESLPKNA